MNDYRYCRCPGYDDVHHEHDGTSGTCFNLPYAPNDMCSDCDDARYAAIGRVAERLFDLLRGTNDD